MPHQVQVKFSAHLKRFIELPDSFEATGDSVRDVVDGLESEFPGLSGYLLHENGKLRQHVNLFLDDKMISDRDELRDSLEAVKTIFVMQALSGG